MEPRPIEVQQADERGLLGLLIFLVSLSVLFLAALAAYFSVWWGNPAWFGDFQAVPVFPAWLWLSTAVLLFCSLVFERLRCVAAQGEAGRARLLLSLAGALAVTFLVLQGVVWAEALGGTLLRPRATLAAFSFYMLTGLHGLHAVGGVCWLLWALLRGAGRRTALYLALYWHFLLVMWVILLLVMRLTWPSATHSN